ncbi:polymorphic toxin-type HINT domain-containing protein [Streptomyces sp. NPDC002992]|uniref:polymorphic toxin-type HINT domain-containing protein n=1 Tax=Streptomyces sp. NPDC002992 TaxID=3154273 RepID=UPI00339DADE8
MAAIALPVTTAVVTTLLGAAPLQEFEQDHAPLQKAQFGKAEVFKPKTTHQADPARAAEAKTRQRISSKVIWPSAATARVTLPATPGTEVSAAGLPVQLAKTSPAKAARTTSPKAPPTAPAAANVRVLDRKATERLGIDGVVLSIARADGKTDPSQIDVTLDYSGFANAYSGNWSSRLRMVQLPACALTTPDKPACRATKPVASTNDTKDQTVTAQAATPRTAQPTSAFTVLALSAGASGDQGSYEATPLSPSATWAGGGSNGDFTWSYPMDVVPAPAGPAPGPSISYSAQSVDGRTSSTSAQPSWIGEGFDLATSYIERSYGSCDDDGQDNKADQCWREDNASIVLNGKSSTLVKDETSGEWHLQGDDGERVVRGLGAVNGDQGDAGATGDQGEFWTVTTTDGTQYVFGKNRLDGWATGKPETNSVWTVPVFGDDSGEPGYSAGTTFSARSKNQAWRWNLDYVVDPHGNVMTYWYDKELNYYAKNGSTGNGTEYTRAGYLKRIDYGQRTDTIFSTTQPAAARVKFTVQERCIPVAGGETCTNLTTTNKAAWPDVPFDQICKKDTVCTDQPAPSFFSRKRLTDITTQVYKGTGTGADTDYRDVNNWHLEHSFPDPGDGSNAGLWLKSIQHTGKSTSGTGTAISLPAVTFTGIQLHNRVDKTGDDVPAFIKWRVRKVTSETGSILTANYSDPECIADTNIPAALDKNTKRCYPVKWIPPSNPTPGTDPQPRTDWFHKYVVTQVIESDPTGGSPGKITTYEYDPAGGAWAYDDQSPITQAKYRTWGTWRGYKKVTTLTGEAAGIRSKSVSLYYRGMNGDKQLGTTATRSESITDSRGTTVTDEEQFAGQPREQITYNGTTGGEVSSTVTTPWSHNTATATHSYGTVRAHIVRTGTETKRIPIAGTADITSTATTTYDTTSGLPLKAERTAGGKKDCTLTHYAQNTEAWILDKPKQVEKVSVGCSVTPRRTGDPATTDVTSDIRTAYDGQPWGAAPTKGNVTAVQRVTGYDATGAAQVQTVSTTAYDALGRPTDMWDTKNTRTKHIEYTPAGGGPVTLTKTVNALGHTVTTEIYPDWGINKASVDPNNRRTEMAYDPLGRLSEVWFSDRDRSLTPSKKLEYKIQQAKASWVATKSLNNDGTTYQTAYAIYDAFLRPRQTQAPAADGTGRVITETKYDTRGLTVETAADYIDTTAPTGELANLLTASPAGTRTVYDGAGRPTTEISLVRGQEHSRTTTTYEGNATTVEPPLGASAIREQVDSRGLLSEKREYEGNKATGAYTKLTYTYGRADQLAKVEDTNGNAWNYTFDFLGRQKSATDPDAGTTETEYNELDQVTVTENAGSVLSYTYDALGRTTGKLRDRIPLVNGIPAIDDSKYLARWSYDTIAKGRPTSSIRYEGGKSGKVYAITNAAYDSLYRVLKEQYTISTAEGAVAGTGVYTITNAYNVDGTLLNRTIPAMGGLAQEVLVYGYNSQRLPTTLKGLTDIVQGTSYLPAGERINTTLGVSPTANWVDIRQSYEDGTKRLARQTIKSETHSGTDADTYYRYDPAGNPVEIEDKSTVAGDRQCFNYDGHRRLKTAWTTNTDCTTTPAASTVGGIAPYWKSFTYDAAGNRKTTTDHLNQSGLTTTYNYDAKTTTGVSRPHLLASTVTPPATATSPTTSYTYDERGNTTKRTTGTQTQRLEWGPENNLAKVTEADGTETTFLNDAEGNRLIRRDKTGTTLHLGETELRFDKASNSVAATRYYSHAGQTVAVRTPQSLTWLGADHNGTANVQIDATSQALTRRHTQPFGEDRGTAPTKWTGDKGFVGGTKDPTGLTHVGAREYDTATGRFISADPVVDLKDPQQINGYAYSNNNPVTFADPDGKFFSSLVRIIRAALGLPKKPPVMLHQATPNNGSLTSRATPFGTGRYGASGKSGADAALEYAQGLEDSGNKREQGGWLDYVAGIGHNLAATGEAMTNFSPVCWFEDCSGGTEQYDRFVSERGIDANSKSFDAGDHDAEVAGWVTGIVGAAKSLAKKLLKGGATKAPSGCKCFLAGTAVLMADGKSKAIEDVRLGDEVIATDPETGESGAREVTRLIVTEDDKHFNELTIATDGQLEKLTATHEHPFWSPSQNRWLEARELAPGMTLLTDDGTTVAVQANRPFSKHARTYNLTVDDLHTYYVLAGKTPVLVHNSNCGPAFSIDEGQFGKKWGKHAQDYGLNPGDASARQGFRDKIAEVRGSHDEVRQGPWNPKNGGGSDYFFYRRGNDLLVTKGDGQFVTMFPMSKPNGWFEQASPFSCGCKK